MVPNLNVLRGALPHDVLEEGVEGVDVLAGAAVGKDGVFAEEGCGEGGLGDGQLGGRHFLLFSGAGGGGVEGRKSL